MAIKKGMTIEDLAVLTQKGFLEIKSEMGEMRAEIGEMRDRFDAIELRLEKLEKDVSKLKDDVIFIKADMAQERADSKEIKESARQLLEKLDAFVASNKKEEQERVMLIAQVRRLEERVTKLETKKK